MIETESTPVHESTILVCTHAGDVGSASESLEELMRLADTAGLRVLATLTQRVDRPNPRFYVGSGKLEELKSLLTAQDADVVVFDENLSPAQVRNLEKALDVKVIDRTEVILDIFANHARTRQAMLQVELAQLEYSLPRLRRMWTHLSRIQGGIGMRGPGEKQLEVDRRLIRKRITDLKTQLSQIEQHKERQIAARGDEFQVSLVGYTNAGKSTLMNSLTQADVLVEDKLFSTLDTRTRSWSLESNTKVLLSDTVGFIHHLPHALVASFHATLEETLTADLLIHVVDASNPYAEAQIHAVNAVLSEIDCAAKPILLALNKSDCVSDALTLRYLSRLSPVSVEISARSGSGLDRLQTKVTQALHATRKTLTVTCDVADGKLLAYIARNAAILEKDYEDNRVRMKINIAERYLTTLANAPSATIQPA